MRNDIPRVDTHPNLFYIKATDNRDGIAKMLYDLLFQKILEFINTSLMPKEVSNQFIGILDIFGFEGIYLLLFKVD